ncbi:MAG TPA: MFS transporter [Actinomycetota bacterium]|nr:MFS transporter [Actinomycetota bacterium]
MEHDREVEDMFRSSGGGTAAAVAIRGRSVRPTLFTPAFITVALAELAYFTADGVLLPALPRYVEGPLRGGNVAVGLVIGAFSLSAFFLRPMAGMISDRRGRRILMVVGASLFALSVAGYLVATSIPSLLIMRLLTGAGEALFFVGALSANVDLAPPERRGEAFSVASLSLYVGLGAGPFIGEAVIAGMGFRAAWIVAVALAITAVVLALRLPPMKPSVEDATPGAHVLIHRGGLLPGLVLFAVIWGMAGFLTFVPLYAMDIGMGGASLVLGLFSGIVVLIRSVGARIPDRLGAARATRISLVLTAIGLSTMGIWRSPTGLTAGTILFGIGVALFTPALFSLAVDGVPANERGAVMGTTSAFIDVGLGLGSASLGFIAAGVGRGGTFLAGAAVAAAGLLLVVGTGLGRGTPDPAATGATVPQTDGGQVSRGES